MNSLESSTAVTSTYTIREAVADDCESLFKLLIELAEYGHLADQIKIDAATLRRDGFGAERFFRCFVAFDGVEGARDAIGYALCYFIYSTFEGRSMYLEDLFVQPQQRGRGIGTALFKAVVTLAAQANCARLEWACLRWNEPARRFYTKLGAVNISDKESWDIYRLNQAQLSRLAFS